MKKCRNHDKFMLVSFVTSVLGVFMNLKQIENGLSYAGGTRARNYADRACCPKPKVNKSVPTYGQLLVENAIYKRALRNACMLHVNLVDSFEKSSSVNK